MPEHLSPQKDTVLTEEFLGLKRIRTEFFLQTIPQTNIKDTPEVAINAIGHLNTVLEKIKSRRGRLKISYLNWYTHNKGDINLGNDVRDIHLYCNDIRIHTLKAYIALTIDDDQSITFEQFTIQMLHEETGICFNSRILSEVNEHKRLFQLLKIKIAPYILKDDFDFLKEPLSIDPVYIEFIKTKANPKFDYIHTDLDEILKIPSNVRVENLKDNQDLAKYLMRNDSNPLVQYFNFAFGENKQLGNLIKFKTRRYTHPAEG